MESHTCRQESGVDKERGVVVVGSRSERAGQLRSDEQVLSQLNSLCQQRAKLILCFRHRAERRWLLNRSLIRAKAHSSRDLTDDISSSEQLAHFPKCYFVGRQDPGIENDL